jgi:hypothetical protein
MGGLQRAGEHHADPSNLIGVEAPSAEHPGERVAG